MVPSCELEKVSPLYFVFHCAVPPSCVLSYFQLPAIVRLSRLRSSSVRPALVLFTASADPTSPRGLVPPSGRRTLLLSMNPSRLNMTEIKGKRIKTDCI